MNLKKRLGLILGVCSIGMWLIGCSLLYGTDETTEPKETDGLSQVVVSGSSAITEIPSVSSSVLDGVPLAEYEKERVDLGLYDENYQTLHEEMSGYYAYDILTVPEKLWYLDIYQILVSMMPEVALYDGYLDELDIEDVDKIFQCVLNDHPEIFYVDGYTSKQYTQGDETVEITFSGCYTMDWDTVQERKRQIGAYVEECLAGVPKDADEYEKTKYVYEYLISHTEYDLYAPDNQNICSVFIEKRSVCQGYAKATQYLLNQMDVFATLVVGQVGGQGHAWNLVRIDGKYYYVDTTWGEASYQPAGQGEQLYLEPPINYDYLCLTTEQLIKTHTIQNVVEVPLCRNMEANYYVREGAYFTTYDEEALKALFDKGYAEGKTDVTLKCGSSRVYKEMLEKLIDGQEIFRYMDSSTDSIAYAGNEVQLSLTFWLSSE